MTCGASVSKNGRLLIVGKLGANSYGSNLLLRSNNTSNEQGCGWTYNCDTYALDKGLRVGFEKHGNVITISYPEYRHPNTGEVCFSAHTKQFTFYPPNSMQSTIQLEKGQIIVSMN
jgi:hypothetical protein